MWLLTTVIWLAVAVLFVVFLFEVGLLPLRKKDERYWLAPPPTWQWPPPPWGADEPLPEWLEHPSDEYPPEATDSEGRLL